MLNLFSILSFCLNVIILIVSISCFVKILANDLKHLDKDVKDIKKSLSEVDKKLDNNSERIATIEGRCELHRKDNIGKS